MTRKDFLLFQHNDWKGYLKELNEELSHAAGDRSIKRARIAVAEKWVTHYSNRLHKEHGVIA